MLRSRGEEMKETRLGIGNPMGSKRIEGRREKTHTQDFKENSLFRDATTKKEKQEKMGECEVPKNVCCF